MSIYGSYLTEGVIEESANLVPSKIEDEGGNQEEFKDNIKILKANWSTVINKVAEDTKNYIDSCLSETLKYIETHPDKGKNYQKYIDLCKKYDTIDKVKKSIKFFSGRYTGDGWFALVFDHPVPDKDGHSIFMDDCKIINGKVKCGHCTFEG